MVSRICKPSKSHSFFLFGARGTGKSTLLKELFSPTEATFIDLLESDTEETYQKDPAHLLEVAQAIRQKTPKKKWIVLDEVQKVPQLLDLVHKLIEEKHFRFALTGSSARKLKRGQANLLAGRAFLNHLYPLTHVELGSLFNLEETLRWGGLPGLRELETQDKMRFLRTYAQIYLKEEVIAEQLVRNVTPFRNFLEVSAQSSGKIINFSKIARDVHVEPPTVQSYFEILEDTQVGFLLPPFHESIRKRQRHNPKFYFFDLGVQRALAKRLDQPLSESTYEYGELFEAFVILETVRLFNYRELDWTVSYLRTKDEFEVDLVIDRPGLPRAFVEIKSTRNIKNEKFSGFNQLMKSQKKSQAFVLSRDKSEFIRDSISYLPWQKGLRELGL